MYYRNWPAISQIDDHRMRLAFALLDLSSEFGQQFAERFGEYFTQENTGGPVPLSVIRARAIENSEKVYRAQAYRSSPRLWVHNRSIPITKRPAQESGQDLRGDDKLPVMYDAFEGLDIPLFTFAYNGIAFDESLPLIPAELERKFSGAESHQWETIEWEEGKMIVVEDDPENSGTVTLVPAECIDLNC